MRLDIYERNQKPLGHAVAEPPESRPAPVARARREVYPARDYRSYSTLLPRAWVPLPRST